MSHLPPRRRFQVGPSAFRVIGSHGQWWVTETWWEIDRRGEKDDQTETVAGPFRTRAEALARKGELGSNGQQVGDD